MLKLCRSRPALFRFPYPDFPFCVNNSRLADISLVVPILPVVFFHHVQSGWREVRPQGLLSLKIMTSPGARILKG